MTHAGRVLVTGSAGHVGRAVTEELQRRKLPVRGFDLLESPFVDESMTGNIQDPADLDRALADVETVVHLAATPDDDDFLEKLVPANIEAIYQLFEAAIRANVKRLILASSVQVVWQVRLEGPFPITVDQPTHPRYWYGATKIFMEAAAKAYAETHDLEMICVRIGWCPRSQQQIRDLEEAGIWAKDIYISYHDVGVFFAEAVLADLPENYLISFATSKPFEQERLSLAEAKTILNYQPAHIYPEGLERVPAENE